MISFRPFLLTILAFAICGPANLAAADLAGLLTKTDYLLSPKGSYHYEAEIQFEGADRKLEKREAQILVQDPLHRRITIEKPESEEGKSLLLEGDLFWLYLPKIKKSVRVPPQISFAGAISAIDLAQPYFSMGYQAIGLEKAELAGIPAQVLRLIPRTKTSAYSRIKLWLGAEEGEPLRAEFFNAKNQMVKACDYEDYVEELGSKRPKRWVYSDPAAPETRTVLTMKKITRVNFVPAVFQAQATPELFNSPQARPEPTSGPTRQRRRAGR